MKTVTEQHGRGSAAVDNARKFAQAYVAARAELDPHLRWSARSHLVALEAARHAMSWMTRP